MPHIHKDYDFTVSAFVLHPSEPRLLFLLHRKLGAWLQPGGHIELNEDPLMALHHELEEETGLHPEEYTFIEQENYLTVISSSLKTLPRPFYFNVHNYNDTHKHIDIMYLLQAHTDRLTDNPDGAEKIAWLSTEDAAKLHNAGMMHDVTFDIFNFVAQKYF